MKKETSYSLKQCLICCFLVTSQKAFCEELMPLVGIRGGYPFIYEIGGGFIYKPIDSKIGTSATINANHTMIAVEPGFGFISGHIGNGALLAIKYRYSMHFNSLNVYSSGEYDGVLGYIGFSGDSPYLGINFGIDQNRTTQTKIFLIGVGINL